MKLSELSFNGIFRDYQQTVLDNILLHLDDNKIHIVAAPGSGKTILGLELLCRLGKPTLILSPSVTIRQQWGERFLACFLPAGENIEDWLSFDITKPKLITSITYQALHAALEHHKGLIDAEILDSDEETIDMAKTVDFENFDLFTTIQNAGITTICLDEAHHLKAEWQKSLEFFIAKLQSEITTIALTATPPYDSQINDWNRYIAVCGEIDEEIYVPQLVAQHSLCPHQDYVYFNYPTSSEQKARFDYQKASQQFVSDVLATTIIDTAISEFQLFSNYTEKAEDILTYPEAFFSLLMLAKERKLAIPHGLKKLLASPMGQLPPFTLTYVEKGLQFIIDQPLFFGESSGKELLTLARKYGHLEKKQLQLLSSKKLTQSLISSLGKLDSIEKITSHEYANLQDNLRMLILTDYIRKDLLPQIGTTKQIETIGAVPIFETIRRSMPANVSIAMLTGSTVILKQSLGNYLNLLTEKAAISLSIEPLEQTDYAIYAIGGSNKNKVALLTQLFQEGYLQILVGTKSLLGEGWDSPDINTLILASFVGSYMLSNQMRGRAIRINPRVPDKVANIWHLVTLEPAINEINRVIQQQQAAAPGRDFDLLTRRFENFLAPSYSESAISNGITRLDIKQKNFTLEDIKKINTMMLKQSSERQNVADSWTQTLAETAHPEVIDTVEIPQKYTFISKQFVFVNIFYATFISSFLSIFVSILQGAIRVQETRSTSLLFMIIIAIIFITVFSILVGPLLKLLSPKRVINALGEATLATYKKLDYIQDKANFILDYDEHSLLFICAITHATSHEKQLFSKAMKELLSMIENPRYILVKQNKLARFLGGSYHTTYSCPSLLATNKKSVELFKKQLAFNKQDFDFIFTKNAAGRKILLKARKHAYVNKNYKEINGHKRLYTKWS